MTGNYLGHLAEAVVGVWPSGQRMVARLAEVGLTVDAIAENESLVEFGQRIDACVLCLETSTRAEEVVERLRARPALCHCIVMDAGVEPERALRLVDLGVRHILSVRTPMVEILAAVAAVVDTTAHARATVAAIRRTGVEGRAEEAGRVEKLDPPREDPAPNPPRTHQPKRPLTARETQILDGIFDGLSTKSLGQRMGITTRTVQYHISNILEKYGVASRYDLLLD